MASISVSHKLNEKGALLNCVILSEFHDFPNFEKIVAIRPDTWDGISSSVEVRIHGGSLDGCAHTINIVFTNKKSWKVPKFSHIGGLEKLPLVGGTVAEHDRGNVFLVLIFQGESQTNTDGNLGTNNTIATIKVGSLFVIMHRSTFPTSGAVSFAEHFSYYLPDCESSFVGLAVDSVGADERVIEIKSCLHSFGDGLLAHIKMTESSDLLIFVQDIAVHFHFSHDLQLPVVA